jgi:polysaccharide export outer membrane protein
MPAPSYRVVLSALVLALVVAATRSLAGQVAVDPAEYRLGPGDVLDVTVFDEPDMSRRYTLRPDGGFEFPLVGAVEAAGLTPKDVEELLRHKLGEGFLTSPQVSVRVLEFNSQQVFVMGEVGTPGAMALKGRLTVLEALSRAGGLARTAGDDVSVLRMEPYDAHTGPLLSGQKGVQEVGHLRLDDVRSGTTTDNFTLKAGDTVFVAKAGFVVVTGEVNNPGQVVHSRTLTVLAAISMAGGATPHGSEGRARIIRIVDGRRVEIKAKPADVLQPGDILKVFPRLF